VFFRRSDASARRICILGNSHIACLKAGWDAFADRPPYRLTFFGSPGAGMLELGLKNGKLVPTSDRLKNDLRLTSGGRKAVQLADFDAFLLVGLGMHIPARDRRLSQAVLGASLRDTLDATLMTRLARSIRTASAAPVYVAPTPFKTRAAQRRRLVNALPPPAMAKALTALYADLDLRFLPQPKATLKDDWATRDEFVKDAPRLESANGGQGGQFGAEQEVHMNAHYGRIYLESFFQSLASERSVG
jgi:hypothetical protein